MGRESVPGPNLITGCQPWLKEGRLVVAAGVLCDADVTILCCGEGVTACAAHCSAEPSVYKWSWDWDSSARRCPHHHSALRPILTAELHDSTQTATWASVQIFGAEKKISSAKTIDDWLKCCLRITPLAVHGHLISCPVVSTPRKVSHCWPVRSSSQTRCAPVETQDSVHVWSYLLLVTSVVTPGVAI